MAKDSCVLITRKNEIERIKDDLWVKFDIDENNGIDVYEFIDMMKDFN